MAAWCLIDYISPEFDVVDLQSIGVYPLFAEPGGRLTLNPESRTLVPLLGWSQLSATVSVGFGTMYSLVQRGKSDNNRRSPVGVDCPVCNE